MYVSLFYKCINRTNQCGEAIDLFEANFEEGQVNTQAKSRFL